MCACAHRPGRHVSCQQGCSPHNYCRRRSQQTSCCSGQLHCQKTRRRQPAGAVVWVASRAASRRGLMLILGGKRSVMHPWPLTNRAQARMPHEHNWRRSGCWRGSQLLARTRHWCSGLQHTLRHRSPAESPPSPHGCLRFWSSARASDKQVVTSLHLAEPLQNAPQKLRDAPAEQKCHPGR